MFDYVCAEPLRIGTWKTPQTIQPYFYGKFTPPDVAVEVFAFTNPADQKTALLAESLDMCGTTLVHAIHSASRGEPVVVVAALCNKSSALVVKNDSPVKTVGDLKGKKIGYVPGAMHEVLLREALTRDELNPDRDVKLMRVDFFDMGTALAGGSIDAFLSGEPFPSLAIKKGYGRILSYPYYGESIGAINAAMLVKRETVLKNPAMVQALVNMHIKATQHLMGNKEDWLARASSFGTEMDVLELAAGNIELAWEMNEDYIRKARALGERMQALKMIDRQPDYDALFDLSFVEAFKKGAKP